MVLPMFSTVPEGPDKCYEIKIMFDPDIFSCGIEEADYAQWFYTLKFSAYNFNSSFLFHVHFLADFIYISWLFIEVI